MPKYVKAKDFPEQVDDVKIAGVKSSGEFTEINSNALGKSEKYQYAKDTYEYSFGWYGVKWPKSGSGAATYLGQRIGNLNYHVSLPIQSGMYGVLVDDNGHEVRKLNSESWLAEPRDGSIGQVMVKIPEHYRRCEEDSTHFSIKLSMIPLPGFIKVPVMYISAYEAVLDRTDMKLCSIVNTEARYRGGNDQSSWDNTGKSLLGRPVTKVSRTNFRKYARNRKTGSYIWNCYTFDAHVALYWLFAVEYANLHCQLEFNALRDENGFMQGGLGAGVTNIASEAWKTFNEYYPFIPCGYTDDAGNHTTIKAFTMPTEYDNASGLVTYVPRYRGIENPFGHIWKWIDGVLYNIQSEDAGGVSEYYKFYDPEYYADIVTVNSDLVGEIPRDKGWFKLNQLGEFGDIHPRIDAQGGNSNSFRADYWNTDIPSTGSSLRGLLLGGASNIPHSGFCELNSNNAPSNEYMYFGSRLTLIPNR